MIPPNMNTTGSNFSNIRPGFSFGTKRHQHLTGNSASNLRKLKIEQENALKNARRRIRAKERQGRNCILEMETRKRNFRESNKRMEAQKQMRTLTNFKRRKSKNKNLGSENSFDSQGNLKKPQFQNAARKTSGPMYSI